MHSAWRFPRLCRLSVLLTEMDVCGRGSELTSTRVAYDTGILVLRVAVAPQ